MSLAGEGVVAIWNGIRPEGRANFFEWHNREHMPERVGIPGFRRGRRYAAVEADPEFFTLYETDSPQVLAGSDYLARLNAPTPWTKRTVTAFTDTSRSLCRVAISLGTGQGGALMTWRYDVSDGREAEQQALLVQRILPQLAERAGICGAHLCIADQGASNIETAEKKARADKTMVPNWVILVEGAAGPQALKAACAELLTDAALAGAGAEAPILSGLYQLEYSRSKTARAAG